MSFYAGLDAGTQSIKLVVYDPERKLVVASTSAALELISSDDGGREQLASWWIDAVRKCFGKVEQKIRKRIVAVAVSGQQHGFVPVGQNGDVLAPVKLWCDTSTSNECQDIMTAVGGVKRCIELAGNPVLTGYTASKVAWTRRHRPEAYRALEWIMLPHDYLNFYLTGERFCEYGDASGTGWFDVRQRRWSPELLVAIDPDRDLLNCLPPLVGTETMFPILPHIAEALGIPSTVRVGVGGGDNMMAAIGTGCVVPGQLSMSLGTSGTLFAYADHPVIDAEGSWAAFCSSSGGWLPLICTMNCTVATETTARIFGFSTREGDAHIAASTPGASGLSLLPFFNGERTPDMPNGRGALVGMDFGNATSANLHRAAMEGATYSLRNGYDGFTAGGLDFDSIVLTGGGSRSRAWRQMIADVFALPVKVPHQAEGAAFGAALQAMWALQREQGGNTILAAVADAHVAMDQNLAATPNAENVAAYQKPYQRFLEHLEALRPLYSVRAAAHTDPSGGA
jgi:xylulokinase